jgi:hypothetical protein
MLHVGLPFSSVTLSSNIRPSDVPTTTGGMPSLAASTERLSTVKFIATFGRCPGRCACLFLRLPSTSSVSSASDRSCSCARTSLALRNLKQVTCHTATRQTAAASSHAPPWGCAVWQQCGRHVCRAHRVDFALPWIEEGELLVDAESSPCLAHRMSPYWPLWLELVRSNQTPVLRMHAQAPCGV